MSDTKTTIARLGLQGEFDPEELEEVEELPGADESTDQRTAVAADEAGGETGGETGGEAGEYHGHPTGLMVPMDAMAEIHLRRFVEAFPNVTLQSLAVHAEIYFDWANEVPHLQCKMAQWVAAATGQRPA